MGVYQGRLRAKNQRDTWSRNSWVHWVAGNLETRGVPTGEGSGECSSRPTYPGVTQRKPCLLCLQTLRTIRNKRMEKRADPEFRQTGFHRLACVTCTQNDPRCTPGQVKQRTVTLPSSYLDGCSMALPAPAALPMHALPGLIWRPELWLHPPPSQPLSPRSLEAR